MAEDLSWMRSILSCGVLAAFAARRLCIFSSQNHKAMKIARFFVTVLFCTILGLYALPSHGQISCGGISVNIACLKYPLQTYICVDGTFNSPALYGTALLNPAQALTNPQYLLVKGTITFTQDYTFAEGSNIVFLDNGSGFRVGASAALTLEKSDLNGCSTLWAGVEVLSSCTVISRGSTFQDAKAAIILRDNVKVEITEIPLLKMSVAYWRCLPRLMPLQLHLFILHLIKELRAINLLGAVRYCRGLFLEQLGRAYF